jgi:type VI secretion system (T6SS) effector Tae4 (amidase)
MELPAFDVLRKNYPDGDPEVVKRQIGGKVDAAWITNTCAVRLSRAFNYSGITIPAHAPHLSVISGDDGKWYAFRMRELKEWIRANFGAPDFDRKKPADGHLDRSSFASARGIVAFDIHFEDASGHLDLWDGKHYIHESADPRDYFTLATEVALWVPKA